MEKDFSHISSNKTWFIIGAFGIVLILTFILSLSIGSVSIKPVQTISILIGRTADKPSWSDIVLKFRLPKAIVAVLVGGALSLSGLKMQTLFRNPLADPYILGINSGASLGVALVLLGYGSASHILINNLGLVGDLSLAISASIGAGLVLVLILLVGRKVQNPITLLIIGLMFGYATSAIVSLLIYFSLPERIQTYTTWSYGSFGGVTWNQLKVMAPAIILGMVIAFSLPKKLNAFLMGENYAKTMGVKVKMVRIVILFGSSLLAGVSTAFCGPIGFIGVAVPHLCRGLLNTSDHKYLLPAVALVGGIMALLADIIAQLPGSQYVLPINVVTSLLGAPFIIWIILQQRRIKSTLGT